MSGKIMLFTIHTSSTKKRGIANNNVGYVFNPLMSAIFSHTSGKEMPRWLDAYSSVSFDWLASNFMRKCEILHL